MIKKIEKKGTKKSDLSNKKITSKMIKFTIQYLNQTIRPIGLRNCIKK